MNECGIHHVALAVTDFERSKQFYQFLFAQIGLEPIVEKTGKPHHDPEGRIVIFKGNSYLFSLWETKKEFKERRHDRYSAGLHHLAFAAPSRESIEQLHASLVQKGEQILDAPAEYPHYWPGYFALFFADPDGIKLEYVFVPKAN